MDVQRITDREYVPRLLDEVVPEYLDSSGAIIIEGPGLAGKLQLAFGTRIRMYF